MRKGILVVPVFAMFLISSAAAVQDVNTAGAGQPAFMAAFQSCSQTLRSCVQNAGQDGTAMQSCRAQFNTCMQPGIDQLKSYYSQEKQTAQTDVLNFRACVAQCREDDSQCPQAGLLRQQIGIFKDCRGQFKSCAQAIKNSDEAGFRSCKEQLKTCEQPVSDGLKGCLRAKRDCVKACRESAFDAGR